VPDTDDPAALRSAWLFRGFSKYVRWHLGGSFHAVRVSRAGLPEAAAGRPLIVCANHPSWWDPLLFIHLCARLLPDRIGFGVMDAAMLERYGVFKRLGVFGVTPDLRGASRIVRIGTGLMSNPLHALFVTPQGRFTDVRERPVELRPGVAHIVRRAPSAVVLPLAVEYVFWNESKPEALARFGRPVDTENCDVRTLNARLEDGLTRTMDALADESRTRDASLFHATLLSRTGVGGVYDLWRRGRSLARGRRFDASHEGAE
jgi:1-acyl-sn-glycerol-3-phosphate acyltransferase